MASAWPGLRARFHGFSLRLVEADATTQSRPDAAIELFVDLTIVFRCIPQARVVVYSTDATLQGWLDGLDRILHSDPLPSVVSISWGWPEEDANPLTGIWTQAAFDRIESALAALSAVGVSVCAASGDQGSRVWYPGSSAHVLSCGGTIFRPGGTSGETVWAGEGNGTSGGGVSSRIALPAWQRSSGIAARGSVSTYTPAGGFRMVPDVAACAAAPVEGRLAGTSCAAPLWACALALANAELAAAGLPPAGNIAPLLYARDSALRAAVNEVTDGNNRYLKQEYFVAGRGWNGCTGWGTPDVPRLTAALIENARRARDVS